MIELISWEIDHAQGRVLLNGVTESQDVMSKAHALEVQNLKAEWESDDRDQVSHNFLDYCVILKAFGGY